MAFDVFLSHNSRDKPAVRELAQRLAQHGIRVWLDEDQLIPGRPWQALLEKGIEQSSTGAVLVGKDGLGPWEDEEMQALLRHAATEGKPVIPVLLPGAKNKPKLPIFLGNRTWVDLRGGFSERGIKRLVWGITGQRIEANAQPSDQATTGPVAPGWFSATSRRITTVGAIVLLCAALGAYLVMQPGDETSTVGPEESAFTVWTIRESEDSLIPERSNLRLPDVARHRAPAAFVRLLEEESSAADRPDQVRIFRLDDGEEITALQGDPMGKENRGVLVVPASLIARFPATHAAFTYLRSQLPKD